MPKRVFEILVEIAQEQHQDYRATLRRELEWKDLEYKAWYGEFLVKLVREMVEYEARMRVEEAELPFILMLANLH